VRILRSPAAAAGLLAAAFAVYYATCSLLIHESFHSNGWDLGIFDQVVWNTAHGRFFEYSFRDISYAGDHWQPALLLLVPAKWAGFGPQALLAVQATALAAAAIPLFLAVRRLAEPRIGLAFALAYLLSLGVACAVSFDFHTEAFAPGLAFTGLWCLATGRRALFAAAVLPILALKEDAAILVLALCWIAWLRFSWRREAAALAGISAAYGAIVTLVLMPHFRGADLNPLRERYGYLGDSVPEIAWTMVSRPNLVVDQLARWQAVEGVLLVLLAGALLPLAAPKLLPALAPLVALPLLSQEAGQGALNLHYLLIPSTVSLTIAAIAVGGDHVETLARRASMVRGGFTAPRLRRIEAGALVATALIAFAVKSPLPPSFAAEPGRFEIDGHASNARSLVRMIPAGAVVSAQSPFVPHLSEREKIYQFPRLLDAEYVLLDRLGPIPAEDLAAGYYRCWAALPRLGFDLVRARDGISLWRRTRPSEAVPDVPVSCSGQHP